MINEVYKSRKPLIIIFGYGFEDRTTALIRKLESIKSQKIILFEYAFSFGNQSSSLGKTRKWQQNKFIINEFFSYHSREFINISSSIRNPIDTILKMRDSISENNIDLSDYQILFDITSFPKITLLSVFSELISSNVNGILFYSEPKDYELPFSTGVKYFGLLPQFGKYYNPNRKRILIIILGFEGDRALAIWNNCDPDKTIALIGDPLYENIAWKGIAEKENELLLNSNNTEKDYISFIDPHRAMKKIEEIYKEYENENIIIALLGTKFSTIPIAYFIKDKPNIFIVYSAAAREAEHQTIGIGRSITCKFDAQNIRNIKME